MDEVQGGDVNAAAQKIKEGASELKSAVMDQGTEQFETLCKSADEIIRANPYRSVLIAFGVGTLAGIFLLKR